MASRAIVADRRSRQLVTVLVLNGAIVAGQVVAGVATHSLALLADAAHNLTDAAGVLMSLVAVRLARRPPTAERSFGWHRSTVLAAQTNGGAILAVTAVVGVEAVRRLAHPRPVQAGPVIVVALAATLLNAIAAWVVRGGRADLNMRSVFLHMGGDALATAGVVFAGSVILATGGTYWLDPAVSLAIGVLISFEAVSLVRASTEVLLEASPRGLDVGALVAAMTGVAGVESVHDVHAWSLSSELCAVSAHLVLDGHPSLEEAQRVGDSVKTAIGSRFAIAHATLELECEACVDGDEPVCSMDQGSMDQVR